MPFARVMLLITLLRCFIFDMPPALLLPPYAMITDAAMPLMLPFFAADAPHMPPLRAF